MRIWSLHPKYLDAKGLVALWRETLLAKHVLEGKTKGYTKHPQLKRFINSDRPLDAVNHYLSVVYAEASERNYKFDRDKIDWQFLPCSISVTKGQIDYEVMHLLNKLKSRNQVKYNELCKNKSFDVHPLFKLIHGDIEEWEIRK